MRRTHGDSPLNSSSERRVRNRISPIQTNIGSAASVQEPVASQKEDARNRPGEGCTADIAMKPTPANASAIHSPAPSSRQSRNSSRSAKLSRSTATPPP